MFGSLVRGKRWRAAACAALAACACSCSSADTGSRGDPAPAASHAGTGSGGRAATGGSGGTPPLDVGNVDAPAGSDAPAPVGGADPGTFMPSAMLDPNVQFDWPEAEEGGKCEPGTYTGSFECTYVVDPTQVDPLFAPPSDLVVSGPIAFTFQKSENGEFLELANAHLDGTAMDFIGFSTELTGRLDCATRTLTADVISGQFGFGQPVIFQFGEVSGTLSGMLDGKTGVLSGEWSLSPGTAGMSMGTCKGPWTASYTP
jgi:hypothetical protein